MMSIRLKTICGLRPRKQRPNFMKKINFKKTLLDINVDIITSSISHFSFYKFDKLHIFGSQILTCIFNDTYLINYANKNIINDIGFAIMTNSISSLLTYGYTNITFDLWIKHVTYYTFGFIVVTRFRYKCVNLIDKLIFKKLSKSMHNVLLSLLFLLNNFTGSFQHTYISTLMQY